MKGAGRPQGVSVASSNVFTTRIHTGAIGIVWQRAVPLEGQLSLIEVKRQKQASLIHAHILHGGDERAIAGNCHPPDILFGAACRGVVFRDRGRSGSGNHRSLRKKIHIVTAAYDKGLAGFGDGNGKKSDLFLSGPFVSFQHRSVSNRYQIDVSALVASGKPLAARMYGDT